MKLKPFSPSKKMWGWVVALLLPLLLLTKACGGGGGTSVVAPGEMLPAGFIATDSNVSLSSQGTAFTLQVLHASDLEAGVPAVEDAPRFSAVLNGLRNGFPNTVVLSSGDNYIPSPFFNASADPSLVPRYGRVNARADLEMINAMGFQAAAFGNHEFDQGTNLITGLLASGAQYDGAQFPYLSANLSFSGMGNIPAARIAADGQNAEDIKGQIAKTAVLTVGGERIGLVGATTTRLAGISSPGPEVTVDGSVDETDQVSAVALQPFVDQLTAQGINKIVLLAHLQQLGNEVALASQLRNVDVIVAGGSHRVLAKSSDRLRTDGMAEPRTGDYPVMRTNGSGDPIAVVNTASNYRYVGRLVVGFDANGVISEIDPLSGAYAADDAGVAEVGGSPDPDVARIAGEIGDIIRVKDATVFGSTQFFLNGIRGEVRTEETNLGNLSADANLALAQTVDPTTVISLKNGGGIRAPIGATSAAGGEASGAGERLPPLANPIAGKQAGQVSQLDIEGSLSFNNGLSILTITAAELQQNIEHAVAQSSPGATPGRFPQIGGMAFSFDPSLPAGSRVRSLRVDTPAGPDAVVQGGQLQGDPGRTFRLVTLDFLANGGDDYSLPDTDRVDLTEEGNAFDVVGREQAAFGFFLEQIGTFAGADTPPEFDERIQNLAFRNDTVLG